MKKQNDKPTTLEERLVGAFISAIAMACTIAVCSFVFFVIASKGRGTLLFFQFVFSKISLSIIGGAAVLGFFLNFDTVVNIFSSLWGTSSASENNQTNNVVIVIGIVVAIIVTVLLFRQ